jgi:hypothetical protein
LLLPLLVLKQPPWEGAVEVAPNPSRKQAMPDNLSFDQSLKEKFDLHVGLGNTEKSLLKPAH